MRLLSLLLATLTLGAVHAKPQHHQHQHHHHHHHGQKPQPHHAPIQYSMDAVPRPLILNDYINNPGLGQNLSLVTGLKTWVESHAGYFRVDDKNDANLFTWFFPALNGDTKAPLLVWMNGGPGSTSMYGLFAEFGPFSVDADKTSLIPRPATWVNQFNVLFVDNPVGTGFSYTMNEAGFATSQHDVADDLFTMIQLFFQIWPQYVANDFYVTGESYAGKYVPSFATKIDAENMNPSKPNQIKVNLKGISVGDGIQDPISQIPGYGDLLFQLGLASSAQRDYIQGVEDQIVNYLEQSNYHDAFLLFDALLNGDFYPYPTYFTNITGLTNYFNFKDPDYPANPFADFLNDPHTRTALHVDPNYVFVEHNQTVEAHLLGDWLRSIKPIMPNLLNKYKVLIYNGQNDLILSAPACENYLRTLAWDGAKDFNNAEKIIWKVNPKDRQVAGYVLQAHQFTYVVVRDAGHLLPQDQPERAYDMITRFILDKPFTN